MIHADSWISAMCSNGHQAGYQLGCIMLGQSSNMPYITLEEVCREGPKIFGRDKGTSTDLH
jgi:hypothetical protein